MASGRQNFRRRGDRKSDLRERLRDNEDGQLTLYQLLLFAEHS